MADWLRPHEGHLLLTGVAVLLVGLAGGRAPGRKGRKAPPVVVVRLEPLPGSEDLPLPRYMSEGAAGMDLYAAVTAEVRLEPGERALVPTGLRLAIPPGYEGQVRPRSGLAARAGVTLLNSPGTIDADYRGEVQVIVINHGREPFVVRRGDRVAQLVIAPVTQVRLEPATGLAPTERGENGFGSTGS